MTASTLSPATLSPAPLSARLREGTRTAHGAAEATGFVTRLMSGELSAAAYADLAAQHLAVYRELEHASESLASDPRGRTLVFDELTRTPSIESDLAHLLGADWKQHATVLPATDRYVARLREIGASLPHYAAHAYTRYLGDLSGGQVIKRMVQRHYGIADEGVAFYTFTEIPKAKPFKDLYRERLDALELSEDELATAVDEARLAFELNTGVFSELEARYPAV